MKRLTRRVGIAVMAFSLIAGVSSITPLRAQEELPSDLVGCGVGDGVHTVNFLEQKGGFWFSLGLYNLSPDSTTNGGPRLDHLTVPMGGTLAPGNYEVYGISVDDHLQNPFDRDDFALYEQFTVALDYDSDEPLLSESMPDLPDDAQWQSDGTFTDPISLQLILPPNSPIPGGDPVTPAAVEASRPGHPLGGMTVSNLTSEVTAVHTTVLDPTLVPEPLPFGNSIVPWEAAFVCVGDVAVTKTVDTEAATPGVPFTWTITVTADQLAAATGLELEDVLPDGLTVVGEPTADVGTVAVDDGVLRWTGDLEPDATATITLTTQVADAAAYAACVGPGETCTNTAVLVDNFDVDPDNDQASASISFLDVLTETTVPAPPTTAPPTQPPVDVLDDTQAPPAVAQTAAPTFNG